MSSQPLDVTSPNIRICTTLNRCRRSEMDLSLVSGLDFIQAKDSLNHRHTPQSSFQHRPLQFSQSGQMQNCWTGILLEKFHLLRKTLQLLKLWILQVKWTIPTLWTEESMSCSHHFHETPSQFWVMTIWKIKKACPQVNPSQPYSFPLSHRLACNIWTQIEKINKMACLQLGTIRS